MGTVLIESLTGVLVEYYCFLWPSKNLRYGTRPECKGRVFCVDYDIDSPDFFRNW